MWKKEKINPGYQHFLLFPKCFQGLLLGVIKSQDYVVMTHPVDLHLLVKF